MYTLKILEEADEEIKESALWYEQEKTGLGIRFIEIIQKKLQTINEHPERYPVRKGNFREAIVLIFPFIIIYTFYKRKKLIVINSIFHTSRNPGKKYKKK